MGKIIVGLCKGRHDLPVNEYIFDKIEDVTDFVAMRQRIREFLDDRVGIGRVFGQGLNQDDYTDVQVFRGKNELTVYVTGLTAAVAELISECLRNGVALTLMHYDAKALTYLPQQM